MIMDDATIEALTMPSSDIASVKAVVVASTVTATGLGAVNDSDAGVHNMEKQGDDSFEGSKKKKELVFIHGVELVDLDDCDVSDRRLQCNSEDTNDKEAPNREEMDVDDGAPSSV
jgi:hypothetical protein